MAASITTDLVVSRPNVAGRRMLMPESGPMPGSTPTTVPTRYPRNAYHRTPGCSATENPCIRLSSVDISERDEAVLERGIERDREQRIRECDHADAERRGAYQGTAVHPVHQRKQHKRAGAQKSQRLIDEDSCGRDCEDPQGVGQILPGEACDG